MSFACMARPVGAPVASIRVIYRPKFNGSVSSTRCNVGRMGLHSSALSSASCSFSCSLTGVSLRPFLNFQHVVMERRNLLKVRAGKPALGCTKRSRSRKSRARTQGFRVRMQTASGRRVLKRRRAKGRKCLVPQTNPSSGKRA
uniref:TSA: Wollemia nobilis Ref_Wollemi_Transcript_25322_1062 transcribed RNA sequence n=1 Tax=Wollemia nobilis TaxID=56998 RepID=A0A0C9RGW7_9CONI